MKKKMKYISKQKMNDVCNSLRKIGGEHCKKCPFNAHPYCMKSLFEDKDTRYLVENMEVEIDL